MTTNTDREIEVARELGAMNQRLHGLETMMARLVDNSERYNSAQENRISALERDVIKFKSKVAMVATLVSGGVGFSGWAILNFSKIMKILF